METDQLIAMDQFCAIYSVSGSFVESLLDLGLVEAVRVQEVQYLQLIHLQDIERMVRLHDDLEINPQGIEAVHLLLKRIGYMQDEIVRLRNRLRFYED